MRYPRPNKIHQLPALCNIALTILMLGGSISSAADNSVSNQKSAPLSVLLVENQTEQNLDGFLPLFAEVLTSSISQTGHLSIVTPGHLKEQDETKNRIIEDKLIANQLGAELVMKVAIVSCEEKIKNVQAYDLELEYSTINLVAGAKLVEASTGKTVISETISMSDRQRKTSNEQIKNKNRYSEILLETAKEIGARFNAAWGSGKYVQSPEVNAKASFKVDIAVQEMKIPDVSLDEKGVAKTGGELLVLVPKGAIVELDGVVVGSAPGEFVATKGLHHLKITHSNLQSWNHTINVFDGFQLRVPMNVTSEFLQIWKENALFSSKLKADASLTQGEFKKALALARFLENSSFQIQWNQTPDIQLKEQSIFR